MAFYAANLLTNLTLPSQSLTPWPDGLVRAITDHADERSSQYAQWPAVRWQVDGVPVTARLWQFAGGWVAVSDAIDDVYIPVAGVGSDPAGISLAVLEDGDAYHFDLAQPMDTPVMEASHAARADGDPPPPRRQEWHPDQLRLIRQPGHDYD